MAPICSFIREKVEIGGRGLQALQGNLRGFGDGNLFPIGICGRWLSASGHCKIRSFHKDIGLAGQSTSLTWSFGMDLWQPNKQTSRWTKRRPPCFQNSEYTDFLQWWLWVSKRLSFSLIPHPRLAPLPPFFDSQWRRKLAGGNVDREVAIMSSRASLTILESLIVTFQNGP